MKQLRFENINKIIFSSNTKMLGFKANFTRFMKSIGMKIENPFFFEQFEHSLSVETHIEIRNDEIWTYKLIDQNIQEYSICQFNKYDGKSVAYKSGVNGPPSNSFTLDTLFKYHIKYNKRDIKKIHDYDCYQVILELYERVGGDDGTKAILEMYVTEEIPVSANPIIHFSGEFLDFFPMEILEIIKHPDETMIKKHSLVSIDLKQ